MLLGWLDLKVFLCLLNLRILLRVIWSITELNKWTPLSWCKSAPLPSLPYTKVYIELPLLQPDFQFLFLECCLPRPRIDSSSSFLLLACAVPVSNGGLLHWVIAGRWMSSVFLADLKIFLHLRKLSTLFNSSAATFLTVNVIWWCNLPFQTLRSPFLQTEIIMTSSLLLTLDHCMC